MEDDQVDVMTVRRCIKEISIDNELLVAGNGEEALALLEDKETEIPCIILLDINMPRMTGREFLQVLKEHSSLRRIPVVVITSSEQEQDIEHCFSLGAAGYMLKPVDFEHFTKAMRIIDAYWTLSEMP